MDSVEIIIDANGDTTLEVNGCEGPECEKYTEALHRLVAGDTWDSTLKPEFYKTQEEEQVRG